jgi:hypothetical protein
VHQRPTPTVGIPRNPDNIATNDRFIGHRLFINGSTRPVYLDAAGTQSVLVDGERVLGVRVLPPDAPSDPPPVEGKESRA